MLALGKSFSRCESFDQEGFEVAHVGFGEGAVAVCSVGADKPFARLLYDIVAGDVEAGICGDFVEQCNDLLGESDREIAFGFFLFHKWQCNTNKIFAIFLLLVR